MSLLRYIDEAQTRQDQRSGGNLHAISLTISTRWNIPVHHTTSTRVNSQMPGPEEEEDSSVKDGTGRPQLEPQSDTLTPAASEVTTTSEALSWSRTSPSDLTALQTVAARSLRPQAQHPLLLLHTHATDTHHLDSRPKSSGSPSVTRVLRDWSAACAPALPVGGASEGLLIARVAHTPRYDKSRLPTAHTSSSSASTKPSEISRQDCL